MGLFDKFIGIMGGDDAEDELTAKGDLGYEERKETRLAPRETAVREPQFTESPAIRPRKAAPVVSIHTQKQVKVVVVEPKSFDESQNIAEHLKAHRTVVLNLEKADSALAQRMVDFISGTTYALSGNMQKVGNAIFLFVPNNVDISGDLNFRISERDRMSEREKMWP